MAKPKLRFPEFTDDWEETVLEKKAYIYDGTHQTPQYVSKGVKFVSVENIHDIYNTDKFISEEAYKRYKIKPQVDDILMTRITAGVIGDTAIISKDEPLAYYVSLALIRKMEKTNTYFLAYNINSDHFRHELHKRIIHVAFPKKINLGDIGKCKVAFPKESEQQKIADFLSSVDNIILVQEEEIFALEEQKKGVMQKLFNREVRFKADDGSEYPEWEEKELEQIANIFDGTHQTPEYVNEGIPFVSVEDIDNLYKTNKYITEEAFNKEFKIYPQQGDILMTRIGSIGVAAIVTKDIKMAYYVSLALLKLKKKVDTAYLLQYILCEKFQQELWKRTLHIAFPKKINKNEIGKCKVEIPCLEEQQKIDDCLSAYDDAIQIKKDKLEVWKEIKKGLLQQMFV